MLSAWRDTAFGSIDVSPEVLGQLRLLASAAAFERCADADLVAALALSASRLEDRRVVVTGNAFDRPAQEVRHWALAIITALSGKSFGSLAPGAAGRTVAAALDWWATEGSKNPAGVIGAHRASALRAAAEARAALLRTTDLTAGQSWNVRPTAAGPFTDEEFVAMAGPGVYAWRGPTLLLLRSTAGGGVGETPVSTPASPLESNAQAIAPWPFSGVLPLSAVAEQRATAPEVMAEIDRREPALLDRLSRFGERPVFVREGDLVVRLSVRRR